MHYQSIILFLILIGFKKIPVQDNLSFINRLIQSNIQGQHGSKFPTVTVPIGNEK